MSVVVWAAPKASQDGAELSKAEELRLRYDQLDQEGMFKAAIPLAKQACSLLEKKLGEHSKESLACLTDLSTLYRKQGQYKEAKTLSEKALSIRKKVLGPEHPDVATSLNNLAQLHWIQGEYQKAETLHKSALAIREETLGPDHPDTATSLSNLATLYLEQKEYSKAKPFAERALSIDEKTLGPNHPYIAASLTNLGALHSGQGKFKEATPFYVRALSIQKKALGPEHPDVAIALSNLAWLHKEQGALRKAEALDKAALSILEKTLGPEHPDVAHSLNNLATLYKRQGKYGKSEPLYLRALSILEKAHSPSHPDIALTLNNLAGLYRKNGEHKKAELLYIRSLSITEERLGPTNAHIAFTLNNLAGTYEDQGDYEKAKSYYERALTIEEDTFGSRHPHVGLSLHNLALLWLKQGKHEQAKVLLERALAILETSRGPQHPFVATTLNCLARLHQEQGEHKKAESIFKRALFIDRNTFGHEHISIADDLGDLGDLHATLGQTRLALAHYREALSIENTNLDRAFTITEDSRRLAYAASLFTSVHHMLSFHFQTVPDDYRAAALALTTTFRRKGRVQELVTQSYAMMRHSVPDKHQHIIDSLYSSQARYAALVQRVPSEWGPKDYFARLAVLERERDGLWAELREHSSRARVLTRPITIPDVQSRLSGEAALIEYVSYHAVFGPGTSKGTNEPRYAAYILFPDRFTWVDLGPATPIDEQIKAFRGAIILKADADPPGHALYDSIMKPVVDRIGLTNRLFIAPDGNLNLVPFDALVDEYDNYLVERFNLHTLTSGRDLLRPWTLEAPADGPVVVVANPTGADLPGTEHEATLLASLFGDAVTMQHADATETNLRAHERPRILHLATHGTFGTGRPGHTLLDTEPNDDFLRPGGSVFDGLPPTQLDNPMLYSWLDLAMPPAPPDEQADTDEDEALLDDGKLTAYEVSGWDLRGTELVTLSACDTAQGTYQQGEGILGLRRAFAVAGAQTQVMSLWKVSDTSTATLMAAYYRRLLAGEGRSEAMRNTQLELLRDPATRHPKDWAAFVVVGEWAPLSGTTRQSPPPITRPRGCQATLGELSEPNPTTLFLLPLLALARRRRRSPNHRN